MKKGYKNFLVDTNFRYYKKSWQIKNTNVKLLDKGIELSSNNKTFVLSQGFLSLTKSGRYYFRVEYLAKSRIKKLYVGIKVNGLMKVNYCTPIINLRDTLGLIVDVDQENLYSGSFEIYIIVESKYNNNIIQLRNPMMFELNDINRRFDTIEDLNKLKYKPGYCYTNVLPNHDFRKESIDNKYWEKVSIYNDNGLSWDNHNGLLVSCPKELYLRQNLSLLSSHKYLLKILYRNLNGIGDSFIKLDNVNIDLVEESQLTQHWFIIEPKNSKTYIKLGFKNSAEIPMSYYLKNIMLIDLTTNEMENIPEDDINQLIFI